MKINIEDKKLYIKRTVSFAGAICFLPAMNQIISLFSLSAIAYGVGEFGYNIWSLLGFVTVVWLLNRMLERTDRRLHCTAAVSGALMAVAIVYGTYAHSVNDIFQSAQVVFLQFALMTGMACVTVPVSEEILLQFDRLNRYGERECEYKVRKWHFFVIWLLIFGAYIPIFMWFWPGNFVYDAPFQLSEVIHEEYTTHHPLLHTILMGIAYKRGVAMENASAGFQFYTLLQMLGLSASFAYCVYYLLKRGVPRVYCVCALLWFALFPMHAMFSITATKDVLFAAVFLWFMIFVVRLLFDREQFRWPAWLGMILSGVLCCLMRHNAIYALIAGAAIIIFLARRGRKEKLFAAGLAVCIGLLASLANTVLIAAMNAEESDKYRETFCMPLQCLARVASYRAEDLDEAYYNEICMYIPAEDIQSYNPYLADMVKSNANEELLKENCLNFLKLFVKVGLKFPDEYIEAWVTNTMGFWYPLDRGQYASGTIEFYHKLIWAGDEIEKKDYWKWPAAIYDGMYYRGEYMDVPVLGYLHRPDFWVWFLTFFLFWSFLRKKRDAGLTGAIPFMYLATCYLGPISILRYIYCLIVIVPLIGFVVMRSREKRAERVQGE